MAKAKKISYVEPTAFMPKDIMEKHFGKGSTSSAKKTVKKPATKKTKK